MNKEEIIARAISEAQKESSPGTRGERFTTIQNVMNSSAFSSLPLHEKAKIIRSYAEGQGSTKPMTAGDRTREIITAALSDAVNKGVTNTALIASPLMLNAIAQGGGINSAPAKHVGRIALKALPWIAGFSAVTGGAAKALDLKDSERTVQYSNNILNKIRESKNEEEKLLNSMKLLTSSNRVIQDSNMAYDSGSDIVNTGYLLGKDTFDAIVGSEIQQ